MPSGIKRTFYAGLAALFGKYADLQFIKGDWAARVARRFDERAR